MKVQTGTEHVNNNYTKIAQQNTGEKRGKDNIGLQIPGSESWTHKGHSCKIGNMRCPGTLKNQNPQFEEKK